MVVLDGLLCNAQLFLHYLGLDAQVGQLVAEPLGLDSQTLTFLLSDLDLLIQHNCALKGDIVFGLQVLER